MFIQNFKTFKTQKKITFKMSRIHLKFQKTNKFFKRLHFKNFTSSKISHHQKFQNSSKFFKIN